MTFQTAMIGTDGLTVASDKRRIYLQPTTSTETGSMQPHPEFKFVRNVNETLICTYAGGPSSEPIARAIISRCNPGKYDDMQSWKAAVLDTVESVDAEYLMTDEVMVIRPDDPKSILLVSKSPHPPYSCSGTVVTTQICTGRNLSARFLSRHFWESLPVESLKHIALLSVAFASAEDNTMVGGGIDLLIVRDKKVQWENYTEDDAKISKAVKQFKKRIAKALLKSFPCH